MKKPHPKLPENFRDVVFGPQYLPENRVKTHLRNLDGVRHLGRRSPAVAAADLPVMITATTSGSQPFDEVACWYRVEGLPETRLPMTPGSPTWDDVRWAYVRPWTAELPALAAGTVISYRIGGRKAGSDDWVYADNDAESLDQAQIFALTVAPGGPPEWAADARIYHIFVDRFNPGRGNAWTKTADLRSFHGGTLRGVIERLDYIHNLGFNAIWLSPIFPSPSHHGYDATDLFDIEPRFGSMADFEELVRTAHGLGLRVIMDYVPNHLSNRHPTFIHAREHAESPFRDWYIWKNWPDEYLSFFEVKTMPKVNLAEGSPARQYLLDAARFWLDKGVDGYRVDHAEGPAEDFWPAFRRICTHANPDVWLFGEVGRPPPVELTYAGELHGVLDFSLEQALRQTFALGEMRVGGLEAFLQGHLAYFPAGFSLPSFLDNHDTNRFLYIAEGDENALRLAALALYTLPGAPIVYYGTERALSQHRSTDQGVGLDESRLPVDWEEESSAALQDYFRALNTLRAEYFVGGMSDRRLEFLDSERGLYAYSWSGGQGRVLVVIHAGRDEATVRIESAGRFSGDVVLGDLDVELEGGGLEITVPPETGGVIV